MDNYKGVEIEKIVKAAIRVKPPTDEWIITGSYHGECLAKLRDEIRLIGREDGFVTTYGRFVGRKEGLEIAKAAGQIVKKHNPKNVLLSEDLKEVPQK